MSKAQKVHMNIHVEIRIIESSRLNLKLKGKYFSHTLTLAAWSNDFFPLSLNHRPLSIVALKNPPHKMFPHFDSALKNKD